MPESWRESSVGTILVGIAVSLIVVYAGAYNVAATDPHADVVRRALDTNMRRSVSSRAEGITPTENVSQDLLTQGAGHYAESCAYCRGALPGLSADDYETLTGSAQDHGTPSPDPAGGAAGEPRNN